MEPSPYANEEYTVGWICPLGVELAAAIGMMDEEHGLPLTTPAASDSNIYKLGSIGNFKVVVAALPIHQPGSFSAATAAQAMLSTFPNVRFGLLAGIGAGVPGDDKDPRQDIRLGDVVIGSSPETGGVVVYDFGRQLADGSFQSLWTLNHPPRFLGAALANMTAAHYRHPNKISAYVEKMLTSYPHMRETGFCRPSSQSDHLFQTDYVHPKGNTTCTNCDISRSVQRQPRVMEAPVIHYGTIASGSKVIKEGTKRETIRRRHGAKCIEMEAAGLMNSFPCLVIRGVSDYADSHKNDEWQPFAAAVAAACAKEFLEYVQPREVDNAVSARSLVRLQDNVDKISKSINTRELQRILDWICPFEFQNQQDDTIKLREEGTGTWLLRSTEFEQWISGLHRTLYCPGIPGAGKTIMSSIVVEHLQTSHNVPDTQVAFVYCNYLPPITDPQIILLSILRQIAIKDTNLLDNVRNFYDRHFARSNPPSGQIYRLFMETVRSYKTLFVVIDALDEYPGGSAKLHDLLQILVNLQNKLPLRYFFTSRNFIVPDALSGSLERNICAQNDDIARYVGKRLLRAKKFALSKYPETAELIEKKVTKNVDGMFLLARLQMDYLISFPTIGALEEGLENLSAGECGLEEAYGRAAAKIKSQERYNYELAIKTLSWLTFARRPLRLIELQHALATNVEQDDLNPKFIPALEELENICAGLLVFDKKCEIVRLVHFTAQQYLIECNIFQEAQADIARVVIRYLTFGDAIKSFRDFGLYQERYPFQHYCVRHWVSHTADGLASETGVKRGALSLYIQKLFHLESNVHSICQAMMMRYPRAHRPPGWGLAFKVDSFTKVHLAAYGGISCLISRYVQSCENIEPRDCMGATPFSYAVHEGHLETAKQLLVSGCVRPKVPNFFGQRPLLLAVKRGHPDMVNLLKDHIKETESDKKSFLFPDSEPPLPNTVAILLITLHAIAFTTTKW